MNHAIRWTLPKIEQRLKLVEHLVCRRRETIAPFRYHILTGQEKYLPFAKEVDDSHWRVIKPLTRWGQSSTDFVLRSSFTIPADWPRDVACMLYLPLGEAGDFSHPEALIYVDGVPYAACDRHHQEIRLRDEWHDGVEHTLALHLWTGLGEGNVMDMLTQAGALARRQRSEDALTDLARDHLLMQPNEVIQIDQLTRPFMTTVPVTLGAVHAMNEDVPARGKLLYALDQAFKLLETREPFGEAFYASVPAAAAALRDGIAQAGAPLDVRVSATGHAHIDVAWLWTLGQTRRKAGRTFHTVQRLMEQFPTYHFTQSQPQLYDYVRQHYPELFDALNHPMAKAP